MRVAVGSGNPVKRDATARVFSEASVVAEPVPSGVAEQPTGHDETRTGAENRAAACLDIGPYDLGVGIEGGVARFEGGSDQFLVMWAAVTDGDRWGRGAGPSLRLPDAVADRIAAGEELGPVMDDVLGTEDVAKKQGAAGAFTGGRLTRTDALESAVVSAAAPFLSDLY
ncbi:inosine/xanthosine triphosphatase [Halogeometricum borinquense]|uniref:Probable inosine/xanthosine triphosphatase n=1 Tax=Halogeometricum borinquense TaxID=60847 RepID=A0A6C0UDG9_9EURY|nr:inosine/xanthosine triphosphatase [Halogeometricum borinquense]QIB73412.1 inosine/xanthosine triphosphatase [Halogeometricum borinquense]QIQ77187.1 inosine/xanthosine triphosphatase [Halogeometricum borinquense]